MYLKEKHYEETLGPSYVYLSPGVFVQVWDMASLGCGDDPKEMILRNQGACGAGDIGELHKIGFEILSAERFKEVSVPCVCIFGSAVQHYCTPLYCFK